MRGITLVEGDEQQDWKINFRTELKQQNFIYVD